MTFIVAGLGLLAACADEPPPRSVQEFIDKPLMLEAAMVRCRQNRTATRYDSECVNARQAAQIIEAREDRARSEELEAISKDKRQALRRTQAAAIEARRLAAESERLRTEAAYVAQFGVPPPLEGDSVGDGEAFDTPPTDDSNAAREQRPETSDSGDYPVASDGGNAPMMSVAPEEEEALSDLESARNELQQLGDEEGS